MLRAIIENTLEQMPCDVSLLVSNSGLNYQRVESILDGGTEPTDAEFAAIIKAIPVSLVKVFRDELLDDMEYMDTQLAMVSRESSDELVPMFEGMRRHLRRMRALI